MLTGQLANKLQSVNLQNVQLVGKITRRPDNSQISQVPETFDKKCGVNNHSKCDFLKFALASLHVHKSSSLQVDQSKA